MGDIGVGPAGGRGRELGDRVDAADWAAVVALLDEHWGEVLSDDPAAVRRAVNALPPEVLEANPRWSLAANYVNRFVSNGRAPTTIFRGTPEAPEPRTLLDVLAQLTSKVAERRARGRYAEAVAAAAEARTLVDEADDASRASLTQALPEIVFQWAMAWEYCGDTVRATREYTESYDAAVTIGHRIAEASAAGALAWMHALAGRDIQARMWLDRLPDDTGAWWSGRASVAARFARAQLLIDELRVDEARAELDRVSLEGVPERWPAQKYLLALVEDDPGRCVDLLTQIDSSVPGLPVDSTGRGAWATFVAIARSVLLSRLGNWAEARAALESIDTESAGDPEGDFGSLQLRLWKAAAALVTGDAARARRSAIPLIGASTASPRVLVGALTVAAAAERRAGEEPDGAAERESSAMHLRMALELAAQHRLYLPLSVVPPADLAGLLRGSHAAVPPRILDALLTEEVAPVTDPFLRLTPRELAVARGVASGASLDAVAAELFVSRNTVKTQLRSVYRKLEVRSRGELERLAVLHGYAPEAV